MSQNLKMQEVNSDFIGSFKLGDNIASSLDTLAVLYETQERFGHDSQQAKLLRKPIIVWIAAITEAILYDLLVKIKHYTTEGVPTISKATQHDLEGKKLDDFEKYIVAASARKLLGEDANLYDKLSQLRRLRNRVHIQNLKNDFEDDDTTAFSEMRQKDAEKALEAVIRHMEKEYLRPNVKARGHVRPFLLPWSPAL